jgi:hypothetical protein
LVKERAGQGACSPFAGTERSFSGAGTVAKTLAKEQAAALSAEENALHKIKSQLAAFPIKLVESGADSILMLYRCGACDDYASWSNYQRVGRCTMHRPISALALAG